MEPEIIDRDGVIHSGTEDEMRLAFQVMQQDWTDITGLGSERKRLVEQYGSSWNGDLKLVEIHGITR